MVFVICYALDHGYIWQERRKGKDGASQQCRLSMSFLFGHLGFK